MSEIVVSAPGKIILHGEHAVVYGKRALAASLDIRTFLRLRLTDTSDGQVSLSLPDIDVQASWKTELMRESLELPLCNPLCPAPPSGELLEQLRRLAGLSDDDVDTKKLALLAFLYLFCSIMPDDSVIPSCSLLLSSQLPAGAGLGSSAAYASCLAASLLTARGLISVPEESKEIPVASWTERKHQDLINSWAFQAEKIIHGTPSGIDNSVSTYGGVLSFQSGNIKHLERVPQLKILLTNTKVPRSTKVLVAATRERYNKYPAVIGPVMDSIEAISQQCEQHFNVMADKAVEEHYRTLEDLIDINQQLLGALGVSHLSLEKICLATRAQHLSTKLTGAGGGGCTFTLIPPDVSHEAVEELENTLRSMGFDCWETCVGGPGVLHHSKKDRSYTLPPAFS